MGANLDTLKAKYISEAGSIADDLDKLECLDLIDQWYAARTALDVSLSTDASSYTDPSGASVTRRATSSQSDSVLRLEMLIKHFLRARGSLLVDNRVDQEGSI